MMPRTMQTDFLAPEQINWSTSANLSTDEGFAEWMKTPAGRYISERFLYFARYLKSKGFTHHSARAICEHIRFLRELEMGPDEFKLNNNVISRLARWAMRTDPSLQRFFETRRLGS